MKLSSSWKELRAIYNRLIAAPEVNVREMYHGEYLAELLPDRAIEISQADFFALRELCVVKVDIGFKTHYARRYDFKSTCNLLPFAFTEIDDRVFLSFPDSVWERTLVLIDWFIGLGELSDKIEKGDIK